MQWSAERVLLKTLEQKKGVRCQHFYFKEIFSWGGIIFKTKRLGKHKSKVHSKIFTFLIPCLGNIPSNFQNQILQCAYIQLLWIFRNGREFMYNFNTVNIYSCGSTQISVVHDKVSIKNMEEKTPNIFRICFIQCLPRAVPEVSQEAHKMIL